MANIARPKRIKNAEGAAATPLRRIFCQVHVRPPVEVGYARTFAKNPHDLHSQFKFEMQIRQESYKLPRQMTMRTIEDHHRQDTPNPRICQSLLGSVIGILLACSMTACDSRGSRASTQDVGGSKEERIAEVSKLMSRTATLPSPILDAHFVEEQTGDGRLGPSDFASFCALTIAPDDLAAWRSALQPIEPQNTTPKLVDPKQAQPWWVTPNDFSNLEFYSPKSLTGRYNGWVGIAPDGRIFVYSFTM